MIALLNQQLFKFFKREAATQRVPGGRLSSPQIDAARQAHSECFFFHRNLLYTESAWEVNIYRNK